MDNLISGILLPLSSSLLALVLEYIVFHNIKSISIAHGRLLKFCIATSLTMSLFWLFYVISNHIVDVYKAKNVSIISEGLLASFLISILMILAPPLALLVTLFPHTHSVNYEGLIGILRRPRPLDVILEDIDIRGEENIKSFLVQLSALVANILMFVIWVLYGLVVVCLWFFLVTLTVSYPLAIIVKTILEPEIGEPVMNYFAYQRINDPIITDLTNYLTAFLAILITVVISILLRSILSSEAIPVIIYRVFAEFIESVGVQSHKSENTIHVEDEKQTDSIRLNLSEESITRNVERLSSRFENAWKTMWRNIWQSIRSSIWPFTIKIK